MENEFSLCEVGVIYSEALLCGNTLENLDQIYQKLMLNITYWESRRADNMQLHG